MGEKQEDDFEMKSVVKEYLDNAYQVHQQHLKKNKCNLPGQLPKVLYKINPARARQNIRMTHNLKAWKWS